MSEILNTTEPKKNNGAFIAAILLLLLAVGFFAYLWSSKNSALNVCENKNKELTADMDGMNQMMSGYVDNMSNDLRKDFQNMLATYDALIDKDASKADSLNVQKEKIQALMNELDNERRNGRLDGQKIAKLQRENETLRGIMKSYVVQIDSLNTLNLKLTSNLETKEKELSNVSSERDEFKTQAEKNAEQVKKGARLQAFSFTSTGLRMKLNNTTEETNKARSTVQIKSSFTISENPITSSGRKTVYMQIIDPNGKTLSSRSSNVVETELGTLAYSDKKEIDYNNERIDLSIFYNLNGAEADKGNYKVKIFIDGQLAGTDSFTLK
jgi:chromosome segregation ATPase